VRLRRQRLADGGGETLVVDGRPVEGDDLLALLAAQRVPAPRDVEVDPTPLLPFAPRSLRASSLYERHIVASSRTLVKRFFPAAQARVVGGFERVSRRPFPKLKPPPAFYERPLYYMGNHTAMLADREPVPYRPWLDFELELAFVLCREVADASESEGEAAIGGFMLFNDWSLREVQADEYLRGMFGPVVKAKSLANSLGATVVSADEVLPRLGAGLSAEVRVNGESWVRSSTAGAQHSPGALVAEASRDERLAPGDLFAMGTVPGCCGLELDRWVQPGDEVELEVELLGTLCTRVRE
jgi:2-keto-4-pentenoate hydratase/2-oxohepta-3-ene-1,7-dioic acid hydratase in catechol pathway